MKQNAYILVNYVYLSTEERIKFAQTSHEYLITQTQRDITGIKNWYKHKRCKYIKSSCKRTYGLQDPDITDNNDWSNYTLIADVPENLQPYSYEYIKQLDKKILSPEFGKLNPDIIANLSSSEIKTFIQNIMYNINSTTPEKLNQSFNNYRDIMSSAYIKFNGIDRFSIQEKDFFAQLQKFKHHTNIGLPGTYVYSFALNPEKEQPSGTCNMSRLNNAELIVNIVEQNPNTVYNLYLYAVNYNIFRIAAGIGHLFFTITINIYKIKIIYIKINYFYIIYYIIIMSENTTFSGEYAFSVMCGLVSVYLVERTAPSTHPIIKFFLIHY